MSQKNREFAVKMSPRNLRSDTQEVSSRWLATHELYKGSDRQANVEGKKATRPHSHTRNHRQLRSVRAETVSPEKSRPTGYPIPNGQL